MRHQAINVGDRVRVKDPTRFCDHDGEPLPGDTFTVTRKQARPGYSEPWIVLEGERFFKARDLEG